MVATLKGKSLPFTLAPFRSWMRQLRRSDVSQFVKDVQQVLV